MNIPPLFKKKWFWISFFLLLVFAIIWDIAFASIVLFNSLSSGQWSTTLLGLGVFYTACVIYQKYLPSKERKQVKWGGRLVLFVIAFMAFADHGFLKMIYFLVTVLIFSRFMKWIVKMLTRKKRPAVSS